MLLADGMPADAVADRLGVDVRALGDLLDNPAARELTDIERAQIGYRNAMFLYECERERVLRFQRLVPGDIPSNGQREKSIKYLERTEKHADAARKHLETVLRWAEHIRALGGRPDSGGIRSLHLAVNAGERGDLPALAGEVVSDDRDGDADDG